MTQPALARDETGWWRRIPHMKPGSSRFDVFGELATLRRYARTLARDDSDAEDLVQDALVRAYEKRDSFRPGRALRPWLLSILHNAFIDGLRNRRAEARRIARAAEVAVKEAPPAQDHAVRLAELREAFMALPEEQRAALHLVALEGLGYQQAADTLGIPIGTLMSRLSRARASLRALEAAPADAPAVPRAQPPVRLRVVGGSDDRAD
jgi:RNA polymerase sigma-70 factor (ECF subfamily)